MGACGVRISVTSANERERPQAHSPRCPVGCLLHVNAAADVDCLAGDVVGVGGSQEADEIGDVFWLFLAS